MKTWHLSDTHGQHEPLIVPPNIELVIHSGDFSNAFDPVANLPEAIAFLDWYEALDIPIKVLVAGNHDAAIARNLIAKGELKARGITYLEDSIAEIKGFLFFGTPWTPTFNNWHFNRARHKMFKTWRNVPADTDVIVCHGPPKGYLDLTEQRDGTLSMQGDLTLTKTVAEIQPQAVLFGHIHNFKTIRNSGVFIAPNGITYSNASCVTDAQIGKGPTSHGNVLELTPRAIPADA